MNGSSGFLEVSKYKKEDGGLLLFWGEEKVLPKYKYLGHLQGGHNTPSLSQTWDKIRHN